MSHNAIPSIITTHDASFSPAIKIDDSPSPDPSPLSLQPQSPNPNSLLSPTSSLSPPSPVPGRGSLEVPSSPTPTYTSSNEGSNSPTLSTSSVHFGTSVSLRGNDPNKQQFSPSLLSPTDTSAGGNSNHKRKASLSSSVGGHSSDGTEPDVHHDIYLKPLRHAKSDSSEITRVDRSRSHSREKTAVIEWKAKGKERDDAPDQPRMEELPLDADTDPTPFAFKPYQLAHMLDPKNIGTLEDLGGVRKLLIGLGTHETRGLVTTVSGRTSGDLQPGAGDGASQRHDRQESHDAHDHHDNSNDVTGLPVPGIVVTSPDGYGNKEDQDDGESERDPDDGPAFTASLDERRRVYGPNILPQRASKSLLALMFAALKDKVLILLSFAAVIALALGLFQDFGPEHQAGQPRVDWVEGVAIMVAVFIVVVVGSLNDWQKERQFQVLNEKKEERGVKVIRDGVEHIVDIKDVVVGDIAMLEPGEIIPCDGVFLSGHNVRCDESAATGESDAIKKVPYEQCIALRNKVFVDREDSVGEAEGKARGDGLEGTHTDCFVMSGSKVLEGVGRYVVVAVGTKSFNGRIMMALRGDAENTPLQLKLNSLAELIAKLGSAAGLTLFIALMIRFGVQLAKNDPPRTANEKGIAFVNILIISVTLIVVAVPEGLPLAVTLALAFATKRMTKEKLLVRVLGSCETMANATVVCTDKTGTLTQNVMTVVAGSVGIHAKFVHKLEHNQARTNADEEECVEPPKSKVRKHPDDFSIDETDLNRVLPPPLRALFNEAISVNSTAFEDADPMTGQNIFVGNKTETALLKFGRELGWKHFKETRDAAEVVQMIPFSSERKAMGVVIRLKNGRWRFYVKGASEILTKMCRHHVVVHRDGNHAAGEDGEVETAPISELASDNISRTIIFYANQTLRTIALCYRDFDSWPPTHVQYYAPDEVAYDDIAWDLTLIGIVGIEDPLRDGVREAVAKCHKAGVTVKMCTGDNVLTARSIALQCGIYTAGGVIMEGPIFRQLNDAERLEILPRLQVLARSSPEDKKVLVEKLKEMGETVGVTGDGTNDGPALKTAHVGFSMGIAGTEIAKEASDIILMDDNFSSIVKAIAWGRCVNDAVRKFLQFQISTNVTAVVITFVSALSSVKEAAVLSPVQLLWINIIMDTFAALALATDPASEALLDRKPDEKTAPLFSVDMYKQILFQSSYQIAITLIFFFLGSKILSSASPEVIQTLVFNAFVFAQIFNSVNCRRLDNKLNIFEGLSKNPYFIAITLVEIVIQIVIVFVGGSAFQVTTIKGREWGISLALGVMSIPLGAVVRLLPNRPFETLFKKMRLLPKPPPELPQVRPEVEWNSAITRVRDNLSLFAQIRSGRLRSSSHVNKSRLARLNYDGERLRLPSSLMAMVPSLVASSIGAGWAPQSGLSDPAHFDPSKSSAALWEGRIQIHPDTKADDPIYRRWGGGPRTP